jgi:hypothetical protein
MQAMQSKGFIRQQKNKAMLSIPTRFREWSHYSFSAIEPRAYDFSIVPRGR